MNAEDNIDLPALWEQIVSKNAGLSPRWLQSEYGHLTWCDLSQPGLEFFDVRSMMLEGKWLLLRYCVSYMKPPANIKAYHEINYA